MQHLAKTIKADEKMVRFAILNGLLPHISNYVTQQQPKTVPELLQAARIAELTTPVANETNSGVSLQLAGVREQLQKLTEKWDAQAKNQLATAHSTSETTASSAPLNKAGARNANQNLPVRGHGQRGHGQLCSR